MALDLGGTNFRILLVEILSGALVREKVKKFEMKEEARLGSGLELFDFLAQCISEFAHEHDVADKNLPMG